MEQHRGIFLSFESGDAGGKTTQIRELSQRCYEKGIEVILTREPGGTPVSDKIRSLVLDPENKAIVSETEILLYAASRAQHVNEKVIPALLGNKVVICDRYVDSSVAYQGYGLGIDPMIVSQINEFAIKGLMPHRTFMLNVPPESSLKRLGRRSSLDRIEQREQEYHQRLYNGYMKIAKDNPNRILVLDGDRSINEIAADIWDDFKRIYFNIKGVQL